MNHIRTLQRLAEAQTDCEQLRRAGRDVAHELPRMRLNVLALFREQAVRQATGDDFVKGYRAALLDIAAAWGSVDPGRLYEAARMVVETVHLLAADPDNSESRGTAARALHHLSKAVHRWPEMD